MIVLILKDGLGNQLFQYAAAKSLAVQLNTTLKLDTQSFQKNTLRQYALGNFKVDEVFVSSAERILFRIKNAYSRLLNSVGLKIRAYRYFERELAYDPDFLKLPDNTCIEGYWQTEKIFLPISTLIRRQFQVRNEPDTVNGACIYKMESVQSVSLHVRRGDYVTDQTTNSIHGVCSMDYYQQAITFIKSKIENPVFFIFSDDMDWVKQHLIIDGSQVEYMEHNGSKDYEDLRLMYSCKHNIIANSSFSWWGAWLNSNPTKIVTAPANWFKSTRINPDLLPQSWYTF
jgi:Glycosyl transferase family 11